MHTSKIIHGKVRDISLSDPILYIDNEARGRSGHMGHPILNLGGGKIMDFNSNVSAVRCDGHSGFGFMEYRLSEDYGETFGDFHIVPYSYQTLLDGLYSAIIETAVVCDDGSIVAFCNLFSQSDIGCCMPFQRPTYIRSTDGGETWEEARGLSGFEGRVYASRYHEGVIYVLQFCNSDFLGKDEEHLYRLFISRDNGLSFQELCVVPFASTLQRGYCNFIFDQQRRLIVYAYNAEKEEKMDYIISEDLGKTFGESGVCYLARKIRNPQIALFDGQFILHGREADKINALVLYTSSDGIHWDEGTRIVDIHPAISFYSNNAVIEKDGKSRLLLQYSQTYKESCCVNIYHMWIDN